MHLPIPSTLPVVAQAVSHPPATGLHVILAFAMLFLLGLALQILANWIVSKVLVPDNSDFSKAVKLFFMTLGGVIGTVVLTVALVSLGSAMEIPALNIVAMVGFVLIGLYVAFCTPMSVYKIGFLRSVAFAVLVLVLVSIGNFGAMIALGNVLNATGTGTALNALRKGDPTVPGAGIAWLRKAVPSLSPAVDAAAARTAGDRAQPIEVRRAALHILREGLETRRLALDLKDPAAVDAYKRDAEDYGRWVHELEMQGSRSVANP